MLTNKESWKNRNNASRSDSIITEHFPGDAAQSSCGEGYSHDDTDPTCVVFRSRHRYAEILDLLEDMSVPRLGLRDDTVAHDGQEHCKRAGEPHVDKGTTEGKGTNQSGNPERENAL